MDTVLVVTNRERRTY